MRLHIHLSYVWVGATKRFQTGYLSGTIVVRRSHTLSAIDRHDLARIGSILNQIARACNATGDTFRARNIEATLDELRSLLRRMDTPGQSSDELGEG